MVANRRRSFVLVAALLSVLPCTALPASEEEFTCGYEEGGFSGASGGCLPLDSLGPNSLLVMLVDNDGVNGTPASKAQIEFVMGWVSDWYSNVSQGKTSITYNVRDWIVTKSTDLHEGEQLALEIAVAQGVPVTDFDQLVFFHSRAHPAGYGGYHTCDQYEVPGQGSVSWEINQIFAYGPYFSRRIDVIHELGHGFDLGHASHVNPQTGAVDTYGDQTDPMGNSRSIGPMWFNNASRHQLGWLEPGEIETVTASGTWTLTASGLKSLRIVNAHRSSSDNWPLAYYVEYRPPLGDDEPLGDYYNATVGVLVREKLAYGTRSIDGTPETPSVKTNDFALMPGRSLVLGERIVVSCIAFDPIQLEATVHVEFTEQGNGFPILDDVNVTIGPTSLGGSSMTLNADASDPDGDSMLYFWATGIDPFAGGQFYGTNDARGGQLVTLPPPQPTRVHLLVSDGRGHDTGFTPVDLLPGSDSVHHVPGEFSTIQSAVDAAGPGDLVLVGAGVSMFGPGNRDVTLPAGVPMTVRSAEGPSGTVIECLGEGRGFFLDNAIDHRAVISGFTVRHGAADQGAGVFIGATATPTVTNCIFELGDANEGGGVYVEHGPQTPRFHGNVLRDNTAGAGGGLYLAGEFLPLSPLRMRELTITSNAATGNGGGVWAEAFARVANSTVTGNQSGADGGGYYMSYPVRVSDGVVAGNQATRGGGVFSRANTGGGVFLWNCTLADNVATQGGGIFIDNAFVWFMNGILYGNVPDSYVIVTGGSTRFRPSWSDIEGGAGLGDGVFDADPLFSATEPYHLSPGSPCIDRGDGGVAMLAGADGRERLDDPTVQNQGTGDPDYVDVGAFEARLPAPTVAAAHSYSAVVTLAWDPQSGDFRLERAYSPWGPFVTVANPTGSPWHDFSASSPSPDAFDWYRVIAVGATGDSVPSRPTLAIPICARLAHDGGEPLRVDAADEAVFLTLLNQPWQPLSVYADLTGGIAGLPDGQVTEVDHETFLLWLGWEEPR